MVKKCDAARKPPCSCPQSQGGLVAFELKINILVRLLTFTKH